MFCMKSTDVCTQKVWCFYPKNKPFCTFLALYLKFFSAKYASMGRSMLAKLFWLLFENDKENKKLQSNSALKWKWCLIKKYYLTGLWRRGRGLFSEAVGILWGVLITAWGDFFSYYAVVFSSTHLSYSLHLQQIRWWFLIISLLLFYSLMFSYSSLFFCV